MSDRVRAGVRLGRGICSLVAIGLLSVSRKGRCPALLPDGSYDDDHTLSILLYTVYKPIHNNVSDVPDDMQIWREDDSCDVVWAASNFKFQRARLFVVERGLSNSHNGAACGARRSALGQATRPWRDPQTWGSSCTLRQGAAALKPGSRMGERAEGKERGTGDVSDKVALQVS